MMISPEHLTPRESAFVQPVANCRSFAIVLMMPACLFNDLPMERQLLFSCATTTREQMLRITRKANGEVVFKVSGQLNAENVAEVRALIAAERKGRRIVLDLQI